MCLEFPGLVVERAGESVVVSIEGRHRRASTFLLPDVAVGDWVYVTAGTVIERLDPAAIEQLRRELRITRGEAP